MKRSQLLAHALAPKPLDSELKRLCVLHGNKAVREAALRVTKMKRGPRVKDDFRVLGPLLRDDARDLLEGRNPKMERSNYVIAQAFALEFPGQSQASTMRRVLRKLAERRTGMGLFLAYELSCTDYPYQDTLRLLDELYKHDSKAIWKRLRAALDDNVAEYARRMGGPPTGLSNNEIESVLESGQMTLGGLSQLGASFGFGIPRKV